MVAHCLAAVAVNLGMDSMVISSILDYRRLPTDSSTRVRLSQMCRRIDSGNGGNAPTIPVLTGCLKTRFANISARIFSSVRWHGKCNSLVLWIGYSRAARYHACYAPDPA